MVKTPLFGEIEIPDTEPEIIMELERSKRRCKCRESRYEQSKIDCLEEALDCFRRLKEDV